MKAKILNDGHKIFHKKKRKQPRRSLPFDKCLNRIFTSENDPVKLNIKRISDLRDNAIHLVIPFVPPEIMSLFQAGVLNYPRILQDWFGIHLSERVPLGMMTLVYDFDPAKHSLEYARMKRKLPAETIRWLIAFQQDVQTQAMTLGDNTSQFYIPIGIKLYSAKNPSKADIIGNSGVTGQEPLLIEVAKDIDKTHPCRATDVAELVNQRLAREPRVSRYDIQCIREVFNIKSKAEFYYKSKLWSPRYSERFIDWIVNKATRNPDFFIHTRQKAKAIRREKANKA